jgi:hypothetical protein
MRAISAALAGAAGAGGMGAVVEVILVRATSATVFDGSLFAGAIRSPYVTRGIGAPLAGGLL